jgi:hypothetical protein
VALTLAALVLALLMTSATDEGGLRWSERAGRVLPVVPVCVAFGAALALAGRDRRGEARALEALGRRPAANGAAAAAGAALVGALVAAVVAVDGRVSVAAFYPKVPDATSVAFDGDGFVSARGGFRVSRDGSISLDSPVPPSTSPPPDTAPSVRRAAAAGLAGARAAAALLLLLGSAAFALTVVRGVTAPASRTASGGLLVATAAASTIALQAAAAGRVPALVTPLPSTVLLLVAAWVIVRRP